MEEMCVLSLSSSFDRTLTPPQNTHTHTQTSIYPPYFPELGDFHHGLGACLYEYLKPRMQTLPPKTLTQIIREISISFLKALEVRRAAMGEGHRLTKESREMCEAIAGAGQG